MRPRRPSPTRTSSGIGRNRTVEDVRPRDLTEPPPGEEKSGKAQREKAAAPASKFIHDIPQYLIDFDDAVETRTYQAAEKATDLLGAPPGLPQFFNKPILNAATLMKDDNSVLNMPNHTVLNHLLTCSIKNATLAVSATTRYKSKVSFKLCLDLLYFVCVLTSFAVLRPTLC